MDWALDFYNQTGLWWGADPQGSEIHKSRVATIERVCGTGPFTILDLGTGPGATAAVMADAGHDVTAVEFSPTRAAFAKQLERQPRKGSLRIIEADFYKVTFSHRFDLITYWDGFGVGSDLDQRVLLRRMINEWLSPSGAVLMDVFNPYKASAETGKIRNLAPLKGVPGSVAMINRWLFDPVQSRWIDEWQPVEHPEQTRSQSLRCYSPADLELLLEGTGLEIARIEENGIEINRLPNAIAHEGTDLTDWSYLVKLLRKKPR